MRFFSIALLASVSYAIKLRDDTAGDDGTKPTGPKPDGPKPPSFEDDF